MIAIKAFFTAIIVTLFAALIVLFVLLRPLLLGVDSGRADFTLFGLSYNKAIVPELFMKVEEMPRFAGCVKPSDLLLPLLVLFS